MAFLAPSTKTPKCNPRYRAVNILWMKQSVFMSVLSFSSVSMWSASFLYLQSATSSSWPGLHKAWGWSDRAKSLWYIKWPRIENPPLWYHIQSYFPETVPSCLVFCCLFCFVLFCKTHGPSFQTISITPEFKPEELDDSRVWVMDRGPWAV